MTGKLIALARKHWWVTPTAIVGDIAVNLYARNIPAALNAAMALWFWFTWFAACSGLAALKGEVK